MPRLGIKRGTRFGTKKRPGTPSAPGKAKPTKATARFRPMIGPTVRATRATPKR